MRSGSLRSLSLCSPMSSKSTPSRRCSPTPSRVVRESRVWPPYPEESSLATRFKGGPK